MTRGPRPTIVRAVLAEPDPDGEQATRLLAVQAERIDRWAGWRSSARRELLEPVVGELVDVPVPEWPADDVLDWLLEESRAGLALTERGALSRAVAVEIAHRRPAWTWGREPRSEADVEHLQACTPRCVDPGWCAVEDASCWPPSARGRAGAGARRVRLLESVLDEGAFLAAVAELTLAALALGTPEASARVAAVIEAEGWRSDGGPLPSHAVPSTMTEVYRLLIAIGAAQGDPVGRQECTPHRARAGRGALRPARWSAASGCGPTSPPAPPPAAGPRAERAAVVLPRLPGGAPPHLDPLDTDDLAELIRLAHPELAVAVDAGEEVVVIDGETVNPRVHLLMHQVVAERLLYDDPPEDWLAFNELLEDGADSHDAQHAIGRRFVEELMAAVGPPAPAPRPRATADRRTRDRRKAQRAARRRNRR